MPNDKGDRPMYIVMDGRAAYDSDEAMLLDTATSRAEAVKSAREFGGCALKWSDELGDYAMFYSAGGEKDA